MSHPHVPGALALETLWAKIREQHPELPPVAFVQVNTRQPADAIPHVPTSWSRLSNGGWKVEIGQTTQPRLLLAAVLHEAAHGLALAHGESDSTREGRYHNARFAANADRVGLISRTEGLRGQIVTGIQKGALDRYLPILEAREWGGDETVLLTCQCPDRRLIVTALAARALAGQITCTSCNATMRVVQ